MTGIKATAEQYEAAIRRMEETYRPNKSRSWVLKMLREAIAEEVAAPKRRKPQDLTRWPPGTTADQAEARMNAVCGCSGQYACDCVSVRNKARGDAWFDHNTRPA